MQEKHVIENLFLLFVVISREQVGTQSTQDTLAREHAKDARKVGTLTSKAHWHMSKQGTMAHEHVSTLAREPVSTQGA